MHHAKRFNLLALLFVAFPVAATAAGNAELVENHLPPITLEDGTTLEYSLAEWMEQLRIPGASIAVIENYQIAWAKGFGRVAKSNATPVTDTTLFQAASISKPLVALALLHEVERGEFDLDTDINTYLTSWQLPMGAATTSNPVTLRRLLAHSAGITRGGFPGYERGSELPSVIDILDGREPAVNPPARVLAAPGNEVLYSGLGYTLIQLALVDKLNKPFTRIMKSSVLKPLRMTHSYFEVPLPKSLHSRVAYGHYGTGEELEGKWRDYPELAAAGMWSTASDLARVLIEVARSKLGNANNVLSSAMTREMLEQEQAEMGLGFVIKPDDEHGYFAHSGGNQGYRAHMAMLADTGQGVVVLTNSDAGGLLTSMILRSVAAVFGWPDGEVRPLSENFAQRVQEQLNATSVEREEVAINPELLARYVGRYQLAPELVFDVQLEKGQLHVRLGDQPRFPVFAESANKFFYKVADAQLSFVVDEQGRVTGLVLHQRGREQHAPLLVD